MKAEVNIDVNITMQGENCEFTCQFYNAEYDTCHLFNEELENDNDYKPLRCNACIYITQDIPQTRRILGYQKING